ncbi:TolC family protein [Treponema rectale]|uniref:Outer membrane protein TolC n=1 Tax=Treponema rectale TaxID=744512 RepID=A0A840SFW7_9SPIR|nr:TolC family protein [Treponema rectale]MBB5218332.1 outer membrane protein TolC [Treponema rectale]QOS39969.1 TolC family protein [Treponema rectale]
MIIHLKKIAAGTCLMLAALHPVIHAQERVSEQSVTLTLEQAVEYAIEHSKTLKSSDIDLEMKKRASANSWNVFLPNMSLTGTMNRSTEYSPSSAAMNQLISSITHTEAASDFADEESRWAVVGGFTFGWTFTPAYIGQIMQSHANYELQKITWEQTRRDTIINIKKIYYGLLLQEQSLNIQRTTLENARKRAEQAEANYKNGLIPELSLLQTQVSYENQKPDLEQAERSYRQSLDMLAFLIGLPVGTNITLNGTIEPEYVKVDYDTLIEQYGYSSLDLQSLNENIHLTNLGLKTLTLATYFPALSLNYSWQPAYMGKAFSFAGDIGKDDMWYDSGSLSLTVAWNLTNMLPWSTNQQQAKDLKQVKKQLAMTRETLSENQKVQVRKAVDTLIESKAQIENMSRNISLAQRAYDATLKAYRSGTTELLDLRDAENSLNQAKLGLANQKFNYISALLDLENTLNTTLTRTDGNGDKK